MSDWTRARWYLIGMPAADVRRVMALEQRYAVLTPPKHMDEMNAIQREINALTQRPHPPRSTS